MEEDYSKDMHSQAHVSNRGICVSTALLKTHEGHDDEIESIICHELGHWKHNHLMKSMVVDTAYMLVYGYFLQKFLHEPTFALTFGFKHQS